MQTSITMMITAPSNKKENNGIHELKWFFVALTGTLRIPVLVSVKKYGRGAFYK